MTEMREASERLRHLMMAALDDELDGDERRELDDLTANDPEAEAEWRRLSRVKEVTRTMSYRSPSNKVWDEYWSSVYSRVERGIGWILFSLGAVVLLSYGGWKAVEDLITVEIPWFIKAGIIAALAGFFVLLISVIREKVFAHRKNPYKDVIQ